jgi:serine/threonine-protein kinase HipA
MPGDAQRHGFRVVAKTESAGSLSLLQPGQPLPGTGGLRPLPDAELCGRIRRLPRSTLSSAAPKRMSVAGAQHKLLIGNNDNHLKNLSFLTGPQGIALAPAYDLLRRSGFTGLLRPPRGADRATGPVLGALLSTAVYETRAFAAERATWPGCPLAIPLPGARRFDDVRRAALLEAAEPLRLPRRIAQRELQRMLDALPSALPRVLAAIAAENAGLHDEARTFLVGEQRLLRSVQKTVVAEMLARLG